MHLRMNKLDFEITKQKARIKDLENQIKVFGSWLASKQIDNQITQLHAARSELEQLEALKHSEEIDKQIKRINDLNSKLKSLRIRRICDFTEESIETYDQIEAEKEKLGDMQLKFIRGIAK